ncbi:MAG TPA: multicopper oxidase domain-containing protein [Candidatus Binataceae bacterium]|jgi:nitrite reductase (NO-forming)|nr:multicopper oxidase domain-containing protein [Candidatus Binataceae bacterium]
MWLAAILIVVLPATPVSARGGKKSFMLTVENKRIDIGLGLRYDAWTYDGAVPGPVLRARQGDEVTIRLVNPTAMAHGIDVHAAELAPKVHFSAQSGQRNLSFTFRARVPGAFLYQCSAIPTLSHVANGMYGMMIVDPARGWPAAHEVMIVQGEFYGVPDKNGLVAGDSRKEMEERPDFVVFNGMVDRYVEHPIPIKVGELVRVFFVNAGPNLTSTFHVTGVIFDSFYRGGNPADAMHGLASFEVGPGDGAVFEFRVHEAGDYEFIDHALARTTRGAQGVFRAAP